MILTDEKRRWAEIRFYILCYDIFQQRKDMMDVIYFIEAMAQLGTFKQQQVKNASGKILGDPYYMPIKDEVIVHAVKNGINQRTLAKKLDVGQPKISKTYNTKKNLYTTAPRLDINEDSEIIKFMNLVDIFKKAGI